MLTARNPHAVVLDFFAGSGTTGHAVAMLNAEDGGRRQALLVTNNELEARTKAELSLRGFRPEDAEWDAKGIFWRATKPRLEAAVVGSRADGTPIPSTMRNADGTPMSDGLESLEFFELTYLDPEDGEISAAFEAIAPLLWLRAGGRGDMIEHDAPYYAVMDTYGGCSIPIVGASSCPIFTPRSRWSSS